MFACTLLALSQGEDENSMYPYDADTWEEMSETCGSDMQSPIDLAEYLSGNRDALTLDWSSTTTGLEVTNQNEVLQWSLVEYRNEDEEEPDEDCEEGEECEPEELT